MEKIFLAFVLLLFVNVDAGAKEFGTAEERVMEAYLAYYGRPADPKGLEYWSNRLVKEGGNIESIITAFGASKEYSGRFGSLNNTQLVTNIYHQLLGREPDKSGLDFYVAKLSKNELTIQAISLAILDGVTGNDKTIVDNKLSFSRFYVAEGSAETSHLSAAKLAENVAKIDGKSETLDNAIALYRRSPVLPQDNSETKNLGQDHDIHDAETADNAGLSNIENVEALPADTVGPVMSLPDNISTEASSANGANVSFSFNARDNIDGAVTVSCSSASGSTFPTGTTNIVCNASDESGNSSSGTFSVSVLDSTEPKLNLPANLTVAATDPTGIAVSYQVSASDSVDPAVSAVCAPLSGSVFAVGNTTVKCEATDDSKNAVSGGFLVTVVAASTSDTKAPILSVPDNLTVAASNMSGTTVNYSVSATDNIDGTVAVNCIPASGQNFAIGVTTVSCDATNSAGSKSTQSFTVAVVDTTAPQLLMPANIVVESTETSNAVVTYQVNANDNVDHVVNTVCAPLSGSVFAVGDTTVRCEATDSSKNVATDGFLVTVVAATTVDTTGPSLTIPNNKTLEASNANGTTVRYSVSANDDIDGPVTVNCSRASGENYAVGVTTVTCDATDSSGNQSTGAFTISIVDRTIPQLVIPANMVVESIENSGIAIEYQVNASDEVDQAVSAVCSPLSGSVFVIGDTTVNCEVIDRAGNSAVGSFLVSVTPPAADEEYEASVTISWSIPATRENGDPLMIGELVGYELYIIAEASGVDQVVDINDPLTTSKIIDSLQSDTYHFSISSIDSNGLKSTPSALITTLIQAP